METYTDTLTSRMNTAHEHAKILDLVNLGFVDRALERARAWVQQEPGDMAYFTCAQCLFIRARHEKDTASRKSFAIDALKYLDKISGSGQIEIDPWSLNAFRGLVLTFLGKDEEGERLLDKASTERPDDEWLLDKYGDYLYEKRKWKKLVRLSRAFLSLNSESAVALFHLMLVACNEGKHAEALELSERILKINPNHPGPHCLRAHIAYSEARFSEYEKHRREALRLDPTLATRKYFDQYDKECKRIKKEQKSQKIFGFIAVAIGLFIGIVSPDTRSTRSYTPSSQQTMYRYDIHTPRYKPLPDITVKPLPDALLKPPKLPNLEKFSKITVMENEIKFAKHEIKIPKIEPVKLPEIKNPGEGVKALCLHFEKHNLAPPSYCINEPSQKELAERR